MNAREYIRIICHFLENSSSCPGGECSYCPVDGYEDYTWDELAHAIGGWNKVEAIINAAWSAWE